MNPSSNDWNATHIQGGLKIHGKARFPNDFSTSSLKRRQYSLADKDTLTFDLLFHRDKEPYCDRNLIGPVQHFERHLPESISQIKVISDDGQEYSFPISAA